MLQTLREHSGSWFVKVLFGVLVASFALWGVGDIFRNYTSMRPVATVGSKTITQEEYLSAYQKAVNNIQQIAKGKITGDEIKKMGIPSKVLESLIDQAVLSEHIHALGIVVSDVTVRDQIQTLPAFVDKNGTFDREKFAGMLANSGLTESSFVREVRKSIEKQELIAPLSAGLQLPKFYAETLYKGLEEKRIFVTVQIPLKKMTVVEQATESNLEELYKQNQEAFTRPEYRDLSILYIDPAIIRDKVQVSDEQLADEYQRRKLDFVISEKRDVQQIIFSSRDAAQRAKDEIKKGRASQAVAAQFGGNFVDLPQTTRDKLTTEQTAVVFALEVGGISEPVQSALGWSIFKVTRIQPEQQQSLDDVRHKLMEELKSQQAADHLDDLRNKIEDALAGGVALTDIAKENHFSVQEIPSVDHQGKGIDGKDVLDPELKQFVLDHAKNLTEGMDSPIIDLPTGKSMVIRLNKIIPPAVPPLSEIRSKVAATWMESKQQEAAANLAQELASQAKSVADLTNIAKEKGLTIKVLPALSRSDLENKTKDAREAGLKVVRQGFTMKKNQAGFAADKDGFQVIMLQSIVPFDWNKEKEKFAKFSQSLEMMMQRDFEQLYVRLLRQDGSVTINQKVMKSMINRQN
jgi:peptidyl-prolyl cis-trans isomerase D